MKWFFIGDDDADTEYWMWERSLPAGGQQKGIEDVSRADANLPPLHTYSADDFAAGTVPTAGPPMDDE